MHPSAAACWWGAQKCKVAHPCAAVAWALQQHMLRHLITAAVPTHDWQGPTCWRLLDLICTLLTLCSAARIGVLKRQWQSMTLQLWPRCFLCNLGPGKPCPCSSNVRCDPAGAAGTGICGGPRAGGPLGREGGWGD